VTFHSGWAEEDLSLNSLSHFWWNGFYAHGMPCTQAQSCMDEVIADGSPSRSERSSNVQLPQPEIFLKISPGIWNRGQRPSRRGAFRRKRVPFFRPGRCWNSRSRKSLVMQDESHAGANTVITQLKRICPVSLPNPTTLGWGFQTFFPPPTRSLSVDRLKIRSASFIN